MCKRLSIALPVCRIARRRRGAGRRSKGANGGDVVVMEGHPIEFVSKGQEITFYILEDDGKSPTPTKGLSGRAVIQDGGKTTAVALAPAEPNKFVGQLAMPLGVESPRGVFREGGGPQAPGAVHNRLGGNWTSA